MKKQVSKNQFSAKRRQLITSAGLGSIALLSGRAWAKTPEKCELSPRQMEGPYFVQDNGLHRSDIRSDPASKQMGDGVPLQLTLRIQQADNGCKPLPKAVVDIWHCDANGIYSDVRDPSFDTSGQQFLRGYQFTDDDGQVKFTTIYPGWYPGRAVHIHVKVRYQSAPKKIREFTSQLYFDNAFTDEVYKNAPYKQRPTPDTRNERDFIYVRQSGEALLLDAKSSEQGYQATGTLTV